MIEYKYTYTEVLMKRIFALLLIIFITVFSLASCDNKNEEEDNPQEEPQAPAVEPENPEGPDDEEPEEDLDGVDDEYMPDDGWTNS